LSICVLGTGMGNSPSSSFSNGKSSPLTSIRHPTSADQRAAAVHGALNPPDEMGGMRKPQKLEAIRMPTPKKGKKGKKQQTWDNIDDY